MRALHASAAPPHEGHPHPIGWVKVPFTSAGFEGEFPSSAVRGQRSRNVAPLEVLEHGR